MRKWNDLPDFMKNDRVKEYYEIVSKKRKSLVGKRVFDIIFAIISIILLSPALVIISVGIKLDSRGPVLFRQERVTQYGKRFMIFKFRTMVCNAFENGVLVTAKNDCRITRIGRILRKLRIDEFPQLFNIINGDMSFVGTRPEVVKYVQKYTDEMLATLLLPAGVTSEASIHFKDEERMLEGVADVDSVYMNEVLPMKMRYNLKSLREFTFWKDLYVMLKTVGAVYGGDEK